MNTARAVEGKLQPRQPSALKRIPGPAWAFLILAIVVAVLWIILGPLAFLPSEFWALGPIQLANAVAAVLLGAALLIRRPDVWSACRPLGAAVVLFAIGSLLLATAPFVVRVGWVNVAGGPGSDYLTWAAYGSGVVASALGIPAIALVRTGLRRSRRRFGGQGSRRLAVTLWIATLFVVIGRVSAELRTIDDASWDATRLMAGISLTTAVAYLVALTAFTVTASDGARAGERPRSAWWLAAASGLIVILGDLLAPLVDIVVREPVALAVLVPSAVMLVSTLALLSAFALGLSSARSGSR